MPDRPVHLFDGDSAALTFRETDIPSAGSIVWRDVSYEGPRSTDIPPSEADLRSRARYLADTYGESFDRTLQSLSRQYESLKAAASGKNEIVCWFDACLFDQSMLVHVLACIARWTAAPLVSLVCPFTFPGHPRFNGLGELTAPELATLYPTRIHLSPKAFEFAVRADRCFALRDPQSLSELASSSCTELPFVAPAAQRLLAENPSDRTALGRLETIALEAIREGADTFPAVFSATAKKDTPPQYWGDSQLQNTLRSLARKKRISLGERILPLDFPQKS